MTTKPTLLLALLVVSVGTGFSACSSPAVTQGPSNPSLSTGVDYCKQASYYTPSLEIGTGAESFQTFANAGPIALVFGSQGGHHVEASIRVTGINPGQGEMVEEDGLEGSDPSFEAVGEDPVTIDFNLSVEGVSDSWNAQYTYFLSGSTAQSWAYGFNSFADAWDIAEVHEDALTANATLKATVTDACGTELSGEVNFVLDVTDIPGLYGTGYYYYG